MIKKKSNFIILFGLLFSIFLFPKDVFATGFESVPLDDASQVFDYVSGATGNIKVSYLNFPFKDVTKKPKFYFSFVFDGSKPGLGYYFNENFFGFKLKYYQPLHPFYTNYWNSSYGSSGKLGAIDFKDILSVFPYYFTFEDYRGIRYIYFSYTDDLVIRMSEITLKGDDGSYTTYPSPIVYVRYTNKEYSALGFAFNQIYKSDDSYLFNALNSSDSDKFGSVSHGSNNLLEVDGKKYYSFSGYVALPLGTTLESFLTNSNFYSNSNFISEDGNLLEYSNKIDISNSSSSSNFGDLAPKSLGELIASIPDLIAELFSSFTLVGVLLTYGLNSFPPVITFGLYTVFIIGIVILIIKCFK